MMKYFPRKTILLTTSKVFECFVISRTIIHNDSIQEIMEDHFYDEPKGYNKKHIERILKAYFGKGLLVTNLPDKPSVALHKALGKIVLQF